MLCHTTHTTRVARSPSDIKNIIVHPTALPASTERGSSPSREMQLPMISVIDHNQCENRTCDDDMAARVSVDMDQSNRICTDCVKRVLKKVGVTKTYSNISAKRAVRNAFINRVQNLAGRFVLLFIIDHCPGVCVVCVTQSPPTLATVRRLQPHTRFLFGGVPFEGDRCVHLSEDLLSLPNISPEQIYSANVDERVVSGLKQVGLVHVHRMCACVFLSRYANTIRALGNGPSLLTNEWPPPGFGAVMPDVWTRATPDQLSTAARCQWV